ncbi:LacI family DNA-binding transcriptional regulator [Amaricoccus solimangrovi]|uniref:LacI family transcriptional regulator n=1 Tax=Amaricoccus solimangrovi TaxID=2589815 RepID=A0A501W743_9RHOB|nr:LacI family DNA-binding transcriptional regulator [Amaricoccus solimangrovi]TPE44562.1 LacI family transcriptional regulator [Amaricoccus solimangrovi]
MRRPTIRDLAAASGLSVATVNRVLSGAPGVRPVTREKVRATAAEINFYGLGAIDARMATTRPRYRFGFLLLQSQRPWYRAVAQEIRAVAQACQDAEIEVRIEHLEDLSPANTAERARALAGDCAAICVTSMVHPTITDALEDLQSQGTPVFALISQLAATGQVHYIGLDNWKVGRTAAWAIEHIGREPGAVGILMGSPRYRNQEMNESGFRSYFREHAPGFALLEPRATYESAAIAQELTEELLRDHPDLAGLYIAGGGISGALAALRHVARPKNLVVVGYELMDVTRAALLEGTMTLVIAHPLRQLAEEAISRMLASVSAGADPGNLTKIIPFEIYTRENM